MLRIFFKYKRRLFGDLCRCALRALTRYFETAAGTTVRPGVIAAIQTFGDRINSHPHIHFLATEGGLDVAVVFHAIPRIDDARLAELFTREVLSFLAGRELLSLEWAERLISWLHSGFNARDGRRMKVVAFLTAHAVVDRIIDHLQMTFVAEKPPPAQAVFQESLLAADPPAEYFP